MNGLVTLAQLNIRSLLPKFDELKEHVLSANYSVICLTETWMTPNTTNNFITMEGYKLVRRDRLRGRGGGVGMYVKNSFSLSIIESDASIEQLWVKIKINKQNFAIGVVYRQPDSSYNEFLNVLESQFSNLLPQYDDVFCLGDFNIDLLKINSPAFQKLNSMLEAFNLIQIVNSPTRLTPNSATLIDLIITSNTDNIVRNVNVISLDHLSDHELTYCELNIKSNAIKPVYKTIRNFRNFDQNQFHADLTLINFEIIYNINNINDKLKFLNENLLNLINIHAPLKTIKITKNFSPWLTDNLRLLISLRNKARSRWKRTKSVVHHNYYKQLRNYTTLACRNEKRAYFEHILRVNGVNKIWRDLELLNLKKTKSPIPDYLKNNVDSLNDYYVSSIPHVPANQTTVDYYKNMKNSEIETFHFKTVSTFDVQKILYGIKTTAQGYDDLNIKLVLMCCSYILPHVTHIINFCLENGTFPEAWKQALILPIPKNTNPVEFKDLRPISILPTLSKVLERVVESQLREHVTSMEMVERMLNQTCPRINLHCKNSYGDTPLFTSLKLKRSNDFVMCLIDAGCNIVNTNESLLVPLHFAAKRGSLLVAHELIKRGVNVHALDNYQFTPLHHALRHGAMHEVHLLLYYGASVKDISTVGDLPSKLDRNDIDQLLVAFKQISFIKQYNCRYEHDFAVTLRTQPYGVYSIRNAPLGYCAMCCDSAEPFKVIWSKLDHQVLLNNTVPFMLVYIRKCRFSPSEWLETLHTLLEPPFGRHLLSDFRRSRYRETWNFAFMPELLMAMHQKNIELQERVALIALCMSLGAKVDISEVNWVVQRYGFCEEVDQLIRGVSYHIEYWILEQPAPLTVFALALDSLNMAPIYQLLTEQIKVTYHSDEVLKGLGYFALPLSVKKQIVELCKSRFGKCSEVILRRLGVIPETPSLLEMSRNMTRTFIKFNYEVHVPCQFHDVVNGLALPHVIKDIIRFKIPIY